MDRSARADDGVVVVETDVGVKDNEQTDDGALFGAEERNAVLLGRAIGVVHRIGHHAGNADTAVVKDVEQGTKLMRAILDGGVM